MGNPCHSLSALRAAGVPSRAYTDQWAALSTPTPNHYANVRSQGQALSEDRSIPTPWAMPVSICSSINTATTHWCTQNQVLAISYRLEWFFPSQRHLVLVGVPQRDLWNRRRERRWPTSSLRKSLALTSSKPSFQLTASPISTALGSTLAWTSNCGGQAHRTSFLSIPVNCLIMYLQWWQVRGSNYPDGRWFLCCSRTPSLKTESWVWPW